MSTVISVENVSKQYRLGQVGTGSLAHDVNRWWHMVRGKEDPYLKIGEVNDRTKKAGGTKPETGNRAGEKPQETSGLRSPASSLSSASRLRSQSSSLLSRLRSPASSLSSASADYAWALRDVSFEVKQGEVLGIIGRNGAGKSTLLKILSRVTQPTTGEVKVKGRIASLLEVGTGFHPDLTGRENIFLNGAILGMRKWEIAKKFDEIVEFSGCERYIDTPVKRYSSGMYVRLAFAVAAHLEPEILIVDEVLAVGDAEFQKKCLGKMKDVAGQGRTVLFVSHNMTAVSSLCSRAILLRNGGLVKQGAVSEVIDEYLVSSESAATQKWEGPAGDSSVSVLRARVCSDNQSTLRTDNPLIIELELDVHQPIYGLIVAWEIWNKKDQLLAYSVADDVRPPPGSTTQPGHYTLRMEIPSNSLASGNYLACLDLGIHNRHRIIAEKTVRLELVLENFEGIGRRYPSGWNNIFRPAWRWTGLSGQETKLN